jgi:hypothetical protein
MSSKPHQRPGIERGMESGLFMSRWLMAPF